MTQIASIRQFIAPHADAPQCRNPAKQTMVATGSNHLEVLDSHLFSPFIVDVAIQIHLNMVGKVAEVTRLLLLFYRGNPPAWTIVGESGYWLRARLFGRYA